MTTHDETYNAELFIKGKLDGSTAISSLVSTRIYEGGAPAKGVYPLIYFRYYDGSDDDVVGGHRICSDMLYIVSAVNKSPAIAGTSDYTAQLAKLIDTALQSASGTNVFTCYRVEPLRMRYTHEGQSYEERGGIYRLIATGG